MPVSPCLRLVERSDQIAPRQSFYRVLADRLMSWPDNDDSGEELIELLRMIRGSAIPQRYRLMLLRGVIQAYINFEYSEDKFKIDVGGTIESLDGKELVALMYHNASWGSRHRVLLRQLSHFYPGGGW